MASIRMPWYSQSAAMGDQQNCASFEFKIRANRLESLDSKL